MYSFAISIVLCGVSEPRFIRLLSSASIIFGGFTLSSHVPNRKPWPIELDGQRANSGKQVLFQGIIMKIKLDYA